MSIDPTISDEDVERYRAKLPNQVPEVHIYCAGRRTDLPIVLGDGLSSQLAWSSDEHAGMAEVALNAEAQSRGVYIAAVQQGNMLRFEGRATVVRLYTIHPWEQILIGLFFGGQKP